MEAAAAANFDMAALLLNGKQKALDFPLSNSLGNIIEDSQGINQGKAPSCLVGSLTQQLAFLNGVVARGG